MGIFISYSNQDEDAVQALAADLRRARQTVWLDEALHGGDAWWQTILKQIQEADVFICALSNNWQRSKPCRSELDYARALNIPVLPVQIGPLEGLRSATIADLQIVDYRQRNAESALGLIAAVHEAKLRRGPLPEPLPDQPPIPFAYLMLLGRAIDAPQMNPSEQVGVLAQLRQGLEDEDVANARRDIAVLLGNMRRRPDATYRSVREIDDLLATINHVPSIESEEPQPSSVHDLGPNPRNDSPPGPTKQAPTQQQPQDASRIASSPTSPIRGTSPSRSTTRTDNGRQRIIPIIPSATLISGLALLVVGWLLGIPMLSTLGISLTLGGTLVEVIIHRRRNRPPH